MLNHTQITQRAEFECSYVLPLEHVVGHDVTYELHSHRYRIEVTVDGPQRMADTGMVIEFRKFRSILNNLVPDHCFIYQERGGTDTPEDGSLDSMIEEMRQLGIRLYGVPCIPTAENMCDYFASSIQEYLNSKEPGVRVLEVKLRENNDSFASWEKAN